MPAKSYSIEVDQKAIDDLEAFFPEYKVLMLGALAQAILEVAEEIQREIVDQLTEQGAVDLGNLRSSYVVEQANKMQGTAAVVGTNSDYAAPVEFGAEGHWVVVDNIPGLREHLRNKWGITFPIYRVYLNPPPRPHVQPAYEKGKKIVKKAIPGAVNGALKEATQGM